MATKKGRGHTPSTLTQIMLSTKAAGRCQFEGCNKPVLFDELTLREYNKSNVAHIVASSPKGARAYAIRSHQLSDKLSDLMLMCPEHHKLIDDFPNEAETRSCHRSPVQSDLHRADGSPDGHLPDQGSIPCQDQLQYLR